MVSSKCCAVVSPSPFKFLAALMPPCAHTECERFTGTIENRSTVPPASAILITAASPASPPPTTMILGPAMRPRILSRLLTLAWNRRRKPERRRNPVPEVDLPHRRGHGSPSARPLRSATRHHRQTRSNHAQRLRRRLPRPAQLRNRNYIGRIWPARAHKRPHTRQPHRTQRHAAGQAHPPEPPPRRLARCNAPLGREQPHPIRKVPAHGNHGEDVHRQNPRVGQLMLHLGKRR